MVRTRAVARTQEVGTGRGEVTDPHSKAFLTTYMEEFRNHVERVLTVLPRS